MALSCVDGNSLPHFSNFISKIIRPRWQTSDALTFLEPRYRRGRLFRTIAMFVKSCKNDK